MKNLLHIVYLLMVVLIIGNNPSVHASITDGPGTIEFRELLSISESTNKLLSPTLLDYASMRMDSKDCIYILDTWNARILRVNSDGKRVQTIGKKGDKNGEMQMPSSMVVTGNGEVVVKDKMKFCLTYFDSSGRWIKDVPHGIENLGDIGISKNGNIIVDTLEFEGDKKMFTVREYSGRLEPIRTLYARDISIVFKEPEKMYFGRYIDWEPMNGGIAVGITDDYVFDIVNPQGQIIKEFKREFSRTRISDEERDAEVSWADPSAKKGLEKMIYHKAFQSFLIPDENTIVVKTWEKADDKASRYYDVLSDTGELRGRFATKFIIKEWKKDKVLVVEEKDGARYIKILKAIWE